MINKTFSRQLVLIATLLLFCSGKVWAQLWNPQHSVGTITGKYHFNYNQVPDQLVELLPAGVPATGQTFQWEISSSPVSGFTAIPAAQGGTQSSYTFTAPLTQTTYLRRKTTNIFSQSIYSNTVKLHLVSVNWEDQNYVREHAVKTTGITTWQQVDGLAIGQKQQNTTYLDNLGRPIEKVAREAATSPSGTGLWGDVVQFYQYDALGREPLKYLPYTTTTESGKMKSSPVTSQAQYYTNVFNEASPYAQITFDNSPLNRPLNVKDPGIAWAASAGKSTGYDANNAADDVKKFDVDYIRGNPPVYNGTYSDNTLYKLTHTDENGKQVIEFFDKTRKLILKKVQLDNSPAGAYTGWICSYFVYDDFGMLRYEIMPEAVKYLAANGWSFAGTNGQTILDEQCTLYDYDDKRRLTWKKMPGAAAVRMLYDSRDRLVYIQDGNQAALPTPQWTATLYDELDRPVVTALYNTTKSAATLQSDINNAPAATAVTVSNPANTGGGASISVSTTLNPILTSELNNPAAAYVVKYFFFDNYNFAGAKLFNTNFTNLSAYSTSDPNVVPIVSSKRTASITTGQKSRILGSNTFLSSTAYYDEKGNLVQTLSDNIKSGTDIITYQFHFSRVMLSASSDHTTAGTGYTNYNILTKYTYDKMWRLSTVQKKFGSNAMKTLASYEYDDFGRQKTKRLDPGYTAGGNADLESLNYTYNIHSRLTGINKDYALKNPATYNKWGHFFGLYLGYDNRDNVFTNSRLNGQVTGVVWNTQGDDAQRRYNYAYDNANRLNNAVFTEQMHPGDGWSNAKMDFSVTGASGQVTYDLNGNLLNMLQKGVVPGTAAPITIDNLNYAYASFSNKLQSVTDQMTTTAVNGQFGDLKDGANGASPDYVYDANGNVVIDLNKNAQSLNGGAPGTNGISYNFLDKPELIRLVGKGTVKIVYNADGSKLQTAFIPEAGGPSTITTYIREYVYQESATITPSTPAPLGGTPSLAFIKFEEGRIRVVTPVSQSDTYGSYLVNGNITLPNGKMGVYDYYITDYQYNVRMILTEEINSSSATASMETARASVEEPVFGQTGGGNEVANTRYPKPGGWTDASLGAYVSRLGNIAGRNLGPNTLQKVMAGDKVSAQVKYFYLTATGGNNANIPATILSNLTQAIGNGPATSGLVKGNAANITSQLNGTPGFINAVTPSGSGGTTPQAYLTILFFDERFNFIEAADGGVVQQQVASSVTGAGASLTLGNIKAPKNGYVYAYVSNRSDQDVYFDNFNVGIVRGNIIEENHYYAFGLKITGISSKKPGDANEGVMSNLFQYQASYSEFDQDIGWYDFALRNYDPQIGRWVQQDPFAEFPSAYTGMGNDPVNVVDPTGGSIFDGLTTAGMLTVTTFLGAFVGGVVEAAMGGDTWTGVAIGAGVGLGAGVAAVSLRVAATLGLQSMNIAATVINTSLSSVQAGRSVAGANSLAEAEDLSHGPNVGNSFIKFEFAGPNAPPQTTWPDFATISSNYPRPYSPGPCDGGYENQCAIRVSLALRKSGVALNNVKNVTNPGGGTKCKHGDVLGATNLATWLSDKSRLGTPKKFDGTKDDVATLLAGKTGIIYFRQYDENYGGSTPMRSYNNVHIDLWDGSNIEAPYLEQMLDSKEIWFWEIK